MRSRGSIATEKSTRADHEYAHGMTSSRDIVFDETQPAWRNRFLLTIIACEAMILTAILGGFALKYTGPARAEIVIAWVVCVIVMPAIILSIRLRTRIEGDTLRVWVPPFPGWRIEPTAIVHAEYRRAHPLGEMGGWGYKITKKHGHVQNIYGEAFVSITLDNGKRRTIGTQRPDELLTAIRVVAQLPPDESEIDEMRGAATRVEDAQSCW